MSQAQLAGEELTKGFISQLESGIVRPSIRSLQLIAGRLGKPLDYFLGDERLDTAKRVTFHRLAAEAAVEEGEWAAVREHADAALSAGPEATDRAAALYFLARAESAVRAFERSFEIISEALALLRPETDAQLIAQLLSLRGYCYAEIGQVSAATESYESARDLIERHEVVDPRLRSRVCVSLGLMYRTLGRLSKAIGAYESALTLATRSSSARLAAQSFMGIAVTHYDAGEYDAAIGAYRRALDLFQRIEDSRLELRALQSIADVQFESGETETAKGTAERVLARAIEIGDSRHEGIAEMILSRVALRRGESDEALRRAQHAEELLRGLGDRVQQADALGALGAAYESRGLVDDADAAYQASLDLYAEIKDFADRSEMAAEYARVLRARGETAKAFEMLELARSGATAH